MLAGKLKTLGFTELEAKCIIALSESGRMTGYEVAKIIGASRSNVYSALSVLTDKSVIRSIKGTPVYYQVLPIKEFVTTIQSGVSTSLEYVLENMPKPTQDEHDFFSLEGQQVVLERVNLEINLAKKEVLGDIWSEEFPLFEEALLRVEKRKKTQVRMIVVGEVETELRQILPHQREESWQKQGWRKFAFVFDRKLALVGARGDKIATRALISEHPVIVNLLLNSMFQDLIIEEIMKDFGPQMAEKYGRNFEELLRKYTGEDWSTFRP